MSGVRAGSPAQTRLEAWDALVPPGAGALREGFLAAWEQAEVAGLAPVRLTVEGPSGELRGGAAGQLYDLDAAVIQRAVLPAAVRWVRRIWPRFLVFRVLELGAPCAHVNPLLVAPGSADGEVAREVVAQAIDVAARSAATMIVVQDLIGDPGLEAELRAQRFAAVAALPTVVLALRWEGFEAYVSSMRHRYRRRVRCIMRDSAHLHAELVQDFGGLADEFSRLWRHVYDRATETRREILGPPFFRAAAGLEELSAIVLRREDGSLAAFGLLLEDHPWLHFLQCGFEAQAGRQEAAYFRLMLEIVRHGIEAGLAHLNLGCTTVGPKLDLGGVPVALEAWIRHRNRLVQWAFVAGARRWVHPPPVAARRVFAQVS